MLILQTTLVFGAVFCTSFADLGNEIHAPSTTTASPPQCIPYITCDPQTVEDPCGPGCRCLDYENITMCIPPCSDKIKTKCSRV
uniref:Putative secreted protein n=1 Tax=Ixodes scapularis TaxID=6945 RepID=A0A4D5RE87_IXOSC